MPSIPPPEYADEHAVLAVDAPTASLPADVDPIRSTSRLGAGISLVPSLVRPVMSLDLGEGNPAEVGP